MNRKRRDKNKLQENKKGMVITMSVGERIKSRRKEKGLTQIQLAEQVGVSSQAISKWETNSGMPDISQILPLSAALSMTTDEILGNQDRRKELEMGWINTLRQYGDLSVELLEFTNKALRDFPNDETFLYRRICDEYFLSQNDKFTDDKRARYLDLAMVHALEFQEKFPDSDVIIGSLVDIYVSRGMRDKATEWAYKSKKSEDRDRLLKRCLTGEELRRHRQKIIDKMLQDLIIEMTWLDLSSLDTAEAIIKAAIPDNNYIYYNDLLFSIAIRRAEFFVLNNELDKAVEAIRKALEIAKSYKMESGQLTAPVFDCLIHQQTDDMSLLEQFPYCLKQFNTNDLMERGDFNEILRDAEISLAKYKHNKIKNAKLTVEEFELLVRQGRGGAVLRLKKETDKSPFKRIVINAALNDNRYDSQCSDDQASFVYELIKTFKNQEELIRDITSYYKNDFGDNFAHYLDMLVIFAQNDDEYSSSIIKKFYNKTYKLLLGRKEIPEGYDTKRDEYVASATAAIKIGSITTQTLFSDIGALLAKKDIYSIGEFFLWDIKETIESDFEEALTKNDENIQRFISAYNEEKEREELFSKINIEKTNEFKDVNYIIEHIKSGKPINFGMRRYLKNTAPAHDFELSELAYEETDIKRKTVLYSIIPDIIGINLVEEAKKYEHALNNKQSPEYLLAVKIINHLGRRFSSTPEIREYAKELISKGYSDNVLVGLRAQIYEPSDKKDFINYVKSIPVEISDNDAWHMANFAVLGMWETRPNNAPAELLFYVYETTLCATCRRNAVKIMKRHNLLTDAIIAEAQYDSERETREIVMKGEYYE